MEEAPIHQRTCRVTWKPQKVSAYVAHSVAVTHFLKDADASLILFLPFHIPRFKFSFVCFGI